MFGLRSFQNWTFFAFLLVLLQPIVLYLLSALVLPEAGSETALNLHDHYYAHSRWFFILAVSLLAVSLLRDLVLAGSLPNTLNVVAHGLFFVAWGIAIFTQREAYHRGLVIYTLVLMVAYIAALFRSLQ